MSDHQFTAEEIRMLAECEREMDEGRQPFVVNGGHRWAVLPEVMEELGFKSGQTVSDALVTAMLKCSLKAMTVRASAKALH